MPSAYPKSMTATLLAWLRQLAAAMQFFKYLYLLGGFDDALNPRNEQGSGGSGREYFFGAMLRFSDEDLRYLLLTSGGAVSGAAQSQRRNVRKSSVEQ